MKQQRCYLRSCQPLAANTVWAGLEWSGRSLYDEPSTGSSNTLGDILFIYIFVLVYKVDRTAMKWIIVDFTKG